MEHVWEGRQQGPPQHHCLTDGQENGGDGHFAKGHCDARLQTDQQKKFHLRGRAHAGAREGMWPKLGTNSLVRYFVTVSNDR